MQPLALLLLLLHASSGSSFVGQAKVRRPTSHTIVHMSREREMISRASERRGERRGYYVRPAIALERGGGFFIPGLEGWRLRFTISGTVLALLAVERASGLEADPPRVVSMAVAAAAAFALLARAILQLLGDLPAWVPTTFSQTQSAETGVVRKTFFLPSLPAQSCEDIAWTANTLLDTTNSKAVSYFCA